MSPIKIVEASAGSGKTFELAREFVRVLLSPPGHPGPGSEILAVTFTNKASFEMKERVLCFLKKIALDIFGSEEEKTSILPGPLSDGKDARGRALFALDSIVENYSGFRVQTIDSLINSMLEASPMSLNLPARFDIKTDSSRGVKYSFDELITLSCSDKKIRKVILDFIDCYLTVENKTGWFAEKSVIEVIVFFLMLTNNYGKKPAKSPPVKIKDLKDKLFNSIRLMSRNPPEGSKKTLLDFFEKIQAPRDIRTDKIINKTTSSAGYPLRKGFDAPPEKEIQWHGFKKHLRELCEAEAGIRFNPYIDIFDLIFDGLGNYSAGENIVFLQEINRLASPIFSRNLMDPNELFLRLSSRFGCYMLDEFQDTSLLQWLNLAPLIEESLSAGGSLFCVGDRKQAIYRFRGGDFTLTEKIASAYAGYGVERKLLSNNFRSKKNIVLFNNRIFSRDNLLRFLSSLDEETFSEQDFEDVLCVFENSGQTWIESEDEGYVDVRLEEPGKGEDGEETASENVVSLCRELMSRFPASEIAVLTRDNKSAEKISGRLIASGIPVQSDRTLNIKENRIIKEIISLLRFFSFPPDDISFASFIQGDVFLNSTGLKNYSLRGLVSSWAVKKDRGPLYVYFRKQMPEIWDGFIKDFFKSAGFVPLYEFVLRIISKFSVLRDFTGSQAFVMKLLEIISNSEAEQEDVSIDSFLCYLDQAGEDEFHLENIHSDSVNIMTVHKAKGLEFQAVILPFFDINIKTDSRFSAIVDVGENEINLLKINKPCTMVSEKLSVKYAREFKRAVIDELNVSYVALTRARRELYLFLAEKAGNKKNKARLLIPSSLELGEKTPPLILKRKSAGKILSASVYADSFKFLRDEFSPDDPAASREMLNGEAVHYILSQISDPGDAPVARLALESAVRGFALQDEPFMVKTLRALLDDKKISNIFSARPGEELYTEKELVDSSGLTKRIDRLIVGAKSIRVIDFKMSENTVDDIFQIKNYLSTVSELFPGRTVEGFIIYILSQKALRVHG